MNISTLKRYVCLSTIAVAFLLVSGHYSQVSAQRDPFAKPSFLRPRPQGVSGTSGSKGLGAGPAAPVSYGPPVVEARIEYYKRLREAAAANGQPLPKVTSVLTVNELAVTGIFKTPRGYAAMVEATPIKLSYTIYPGEKFFDGQLVAVEENRLVFRRVTKTGPGKFVASVENKPLKQYSNKAQIEGTAPAQPTEKTVQIATAPKVSAPSQFMSPLDEMSKQPTDDEKMKPKKGSKKPVKIAKNGK